MLNEEAIGEFRRVSKIHEDWLVHTIVGPDLLTKGELADLQLNCELPLDSVLDLPTVAYYLGKQAAHLNTDAYKSLSFDDLTAQFTDLERASITDLRLRAATEVRRIAQYTANSTQATLQSALTKGIQDAADGDLLSCLWNQERIATEVFSKSFTLLQNIYSLAMLDLVHVAKSHAQLNTMVQAEGIYTEGMDSQVMAQRGSTFVPITARDLMTKSLSGMNLHYVPPGAQYSEGKIQIVDIEKFEDALSKADPAPKPPTGSPNTPSKPGSISGVAAPDQTPGPGAGGASVTNAPKKGVEYDDWKGAGEPRPPEEGWEQSTTGGWRHIKGSGIAAVQSPEEESANLKQKQQDAIKYGRTPHKDSEILNHLNQGTLVSIKKLGANEAGIHNTFRVTTDGGGRGLLKPLEHQTAESHGGFAGTGFGSVPRNNSHGHETAAYHLHAMFGLSQCPPTTTRSFDGATHSIQSWAEDHLPTGIKVLLSEDLEERNKTKNIIDMCPADKREELVDSLMGMVTMDVVMNNNDRHVDNVLINKDTTGFKSIDHSDAFGTGMKGVRNDFHSDFQRMGKKVTIPPQLQTNLRGKSLGDYKRSMGGHLQDWQIGQTYLRAQYALHLQDTEGHLDFNKFLPTQDSFHGGHEHPLKVVRRSTSGEERLVVTPEWRAKGKDHNSYAEFDRRREEKTLPNDMFQSFAKKFISDHKDNPESQFHAAAKELDSVGVFMPPSAMGDPKAYRRDGKQHQYARTIGGRNPPADVGHKAAPSGVDAKAATLSEDVASAATIRERRQQQRRSPVDSPVKTVANKRKRGRRVSD